ncbi:MAG: DUF4783 domain-containing protein [Flavobacterium sp.]|nr:DUF4783 domain-containing protein [Pedobacter sp.]
MPTGLLVLLITIFPAMASADIVNDLTLYLKTGNSKEISNHFSSTVELIILSEEDVYSKAQAEIILKDFLFKHKPLTAKVVHRLDSNPNYRFAVFELETENGNFRTTISLKDVAGSFLITEIRIEFNK